MRPTLIMVIAVVATLLILLFIASLAHAHVRECFASLAEARSAHPVAHIKWSKGCYHVARIAGRRRVVRGVPAPRLKPTNFPSGSAMAMVEGSHEAPTGDLTSSSPGTVPVNSFNDRFAASDIPITDLRLALAMYAIAIRGGGMSER